MTDEEAEEMIMSADGDGNGEGIIKLSCQVFKPYLKKEITIISIKSEDPV